MRWQANEREVERRRLIIGRRRSTICRRMNQCAPPPSPAKIADSTRSKLCAQTRKKKVFWPKRQTKKCASYSRTKHRDKQRLVRAHARSLNRSKKTREIELADRREARARVCERRPAVTADDDSKAAVFSRRARDARCSRRLSSLAAAQVRGTHDFWLKICSKFSGRELKLCFQNCIKP